MSRTPTEFANYPDVLNRVLSIGTCPYGPYRAISRFDARYDDGDTALLMIDPGWDLYAIDSVRFLGINAPEKSTPEGKELQQRMATDILKPGTQLAIVTSWGGVSFGREKYGRLLAAIFMVSPYNKQEVRCLNTYLRNTKLARAYLDWDLMEMIEEDISNTVNR